MNENELFISFLSGSPESLNWYDRRAFVKYALEACRNQHSFGSDRQAAMQSKGISEETIEYYLSAPPWIEETYQALRTEL